MIHVTVWNEFVHEKDERIAKVYPNGIHEVVATQLRKDSQFEVRTATLEMPECGLTDAVLDWTDVLIWWGHAAHDRVPDAIVDKVVARVYDGMGFIALHSAHRSKPFVKLMGTSCRLKWRENNEKERLWIVEPGHPIAKNLPEYIEIPQEETYGEHFAVPTPDELVFISWFAGGNVFRSGCCYYRGAGKIFYFRPGHEEYPIYFRNDVGQVIRNAAVWAKPNQGPKIEYGWSKPLENI